MKPQDTTKLPKVVILATGGTIAGVGEEGESAHYKSGSLKVSDLIDSAPLLNTLAQIETQQVCNINSDDITATIWLDLAHTIEKVAKRNDVDGIVITHGTDTMDETAFFLNMILNTKKPVVLTGSMRPASAISADGPLNIYESVAVAADPNSSGRGVLVQFAGSIFCARNVRKAHTHAINALDGSDFGACGTVCDGHAKYFWKPEHPHTAATEFNLESITSLPCVNVLFFNVDANPLLVAAAASMSDGLVIAGAGAGEFSLSFAEAINNLEIPAVISSRIGLGPVVQNSLVSLKGIPAGNLSPQKAAVLLRLALATDANEENIRRIFQTY